MISQSQSPGKGLTATGAETEHSGGVAENSVAGTENMAMVTGGREDLSTFFSIGVVIDVLLLTAFLIWAVGQWRKTKK
ncbi:hypothetical protein MNBD_GAMMA14-890 [hydrothermal vent metagenome]|uniref:Uncharacterized protein n=1 Tax=hydrothermal vent metagenome TaxID=652676 RepID=A0A3B0YJM3_9ZZZZ